MKALKALVLVMVLVMLIVPVEAAGPPGSWTTDFNILNLAENDEAQVVVTRYGECENPGSCTTDNGTVVTTENIEGGGSFYYNPALDTNFPSNFSGSIVVSADQPIAAIVTAANSETGNQYASDAYAGVSEVSDSIFLPIIMGNLGVWNTRMAIQNAGSGDATITIDYIGDDAPADTQIAGLPPNMMAMVDQQDNPGMDNFNGAAKVTSDQPLAILVDEYKTTGGVLVSYVGVPLSQADISVYMPGFIAQGVWATDFTIVNTTNDTANVTVDFAGSTKSLSGSIGGEGSAYVNGYTGAYPAGWSGEAPTSGYYGAATVTSNKEVVVVYNISNSAGGPGNYALGYVGYAQAFGATKVSVPLIENQYSTGWDTTFSVQNVEGGTANLTLKYSGNMASSCPAGGCSYTMSETSHTFNQVADGHVPTGFLGGVTITSDKEIVVIADQNKTGAAGDTAAGFPGITSQ